MAGGGAGGGLWVSESASGWVAAKETSRERRGERGEAGSLALWTRSAQMDEAALALDAAVRHFNEIDFVGVVLMLATDILVLWGKGEKTCRRGVLFLCWRSKSKSCTCGWLTIGES